MTVDVLVCLLISIWQVKAQCASVELVTRQQWGARPPKHTEPLRLPVNMTFIHHTAGGRCYTESDCASILRGIQDFHMDIRGWDDIGYSFLIGEDGRVYEGRGWYNLPTHSPTYNYFSYGMSIMGNFMTVAPNETALQATQAWIQCGVDKGHIISSYELFGHRDGRCTDCPGDVLYDIIQSWPHYSHRRIPVICGSQRLVYLSCLIAASCLLSVSLF